MSALPDVSHYLRVLEDHRQDIERRLAVLDAGATPDGSIPESPRIAALGRRLDKAYRLHACAKRDAAACDAEKVCAQKHTKLTDAVRKQYARLRPFLGIVPKQQVKLRALEEEAARAAAEDAACSVKAADARAKLPARVAKARAAEAALVVAQCEAVETLFAALGPDTEPWYKSAASKPEATSQLKLQQLETTILDIEQQATVDERQASAIRETVRALATCSSSSSSSSSPSQDYATASQPRLNALYAASRASRAAVAVLKKERDALKSAIDAVRDRNDTLRRRMICLRAEARDAVYGCTQCGCPHKRFQMKGWCWHCSGGRGHCSLACSECFADRLAQLTKVLADVNAAQMAPADALPTAQMVPAGVLPTAQVVFAAPASENALPTAQVAFAAQANENALPTAQVAFALPQDLHFRRTVFAVPQDGVCRAAGLAFPQDGDCRAAGLAFPQDGDSGQAPTRC